MNKNFKNKEQIKLDENYFLTPDGYNGLVLNFEQLRNKVNKENEVIEFVFTDKWYYPKLSMTLNKYLQLKIKESNSLDNLQEIVLRVEKTIEQFKN